VGGTLLGWRYAVYGTRYRIDIPYTPILHTRAVPPKEVRWMYKDIKHDFRASRIVYTYST